MTAKAKTPRMPKVFREMLAQRKKPGFRDLVRISDLIAELEDTVEKFRKAHPHGHQCPACDHIRELDEHHYPAGPSDAIVALHVAAWQFGNLFDGDMNLGSFIGRVWKGGGA